MITAQEIIMSNFKQHSSARMHMENSRDAFGRLLAGVLTIVLLVAALATWSAPLLIVALIEATIGCWIASFGGA
jgi:hypothetical protein